MTSSPQTGADEPAQVVMRGESHDESTFTQVGFQIVQQSPLVPVEVRYSLLQDTAAFTGRAAELKRIGAAASSAAVPGGVLAIQAIYGMPGAGKTALAMHAAHVLRDRFPDRQLFIDLHAHTPGRDPVSAEVALAGLLAATGLDPRNLPETLDGRAELWRDRISGQRALLVLDNALSSAQIAPLLPGGGECLVLITSRRHLGDLPGMSVPMPLDILPPGQAREMFTRLAPRAAADPDGVRKILELTGFLPLAISLLARLYVGHPSWTLGDLANETKASMLYLTAEHDTIAVSFETSYRHLGPNVQQFFRRLGLLPGVTTDRYAAAALAGTDLAVAAEYLDALHHEGLLTETEYRRYGMHDLIRSYARDRALAADPPAERAQTLDRLLDYYQHTAALAEARLARHNKRGRGPVAVVPPAVPDLSNYAQALAWARTERANLLGCLAQVISSGKASRIVALAAGLATVLRQDGPWTAAVALHATAADTAQQVGDRPGQADSLTELATMLRLTGDYPGATAAVEQGLAIYRDLGDRLGQANALTELGVMRRLTEDNPGALAVLEQALGLYADLGDRLGQGNTLCDIGFIRLLTRDNPAAAAADRQALAIYRDLGDLLGQATALSYLGLVQIHMGSYRDAASVLRKALALYRDFGERRGQAVTLCYLGNLQMVSGDLSDTVIVLEEARDICRDLGDRVGQAAALSYLGNVRRLTGDALGAATDLQEALNISSGLGDRLGQATALSYLGMARQSTGDYRRAADALDQALAIHRDLDDRLGQVAPLTALGAVRRLEGNYSDAAAALEEALAICRDHGDHASEAEVLNSIGTLHLVRGELDLAENCHAQALRFARELSSPWDEAHALAGLGRCALAADHTPEACEKLRQAQAIFQGIGAAEADTLASELDSIAGDTGPNDA